MSLTAGPGQTPVSVWTVGTFKPPFSPGVEEAGSTIKQIAFFVFLFAPVPVPVLSFLSDQAL